MRCRVLFVILSILERKIFVRELSFRVHSRTRNTVQPRLRSNRATLKSRRLFTITFRFQNSTLLLGGRLHFRQPCQKQPSTKMMTLARVNTKSGFPGSSRSFIVQPEIARRMRCARSRFSVVRPWRGFTRDMIRERAVGVTRSIYVVGAADQRLRGQIIIRGETRI
jgi:hypothetical protein